MGFFNVKIIHGLMSFKGVLCTVIEIRKGFQRNCNMTWYLYLETVKNTEVDYFGFL